MQASTINMAQALLERGRDLWEQDRYEEASRVLSRLLSLRAIPGDVAERAQFYLGDIQLAQGHYSKARRHLAAAIGCGSGVGETHFLMACALEWDDESDARAAYRHYRKAVQLEPGQPLYSSAYALMRIRRRPDRAKYDREALTRLRNAFAASPDDADIVYNYAFGLIQMGRRGEAHMVLRRARKKWPDHPAFEGLWFDFLADQGSLPRSRAASTGPIQLRVVGNDEPTILKFPTAEPKPAAAQSLRPRAQLKTALRLLATGELREIARNLNLSESGDAARLRSDISLSLKDPACLRATVGRLSPGSRQLIEVLTNSGGSVQRKQLRLRVDGPSQSGGPHWAKRQRTNPALDELRQVGLVYLGSQTTDQREQAIVMIPSDLRRLVREALQ